MSAEDAAYMQGWDDAMAHLDNERWRRIDGAEQPEPGQRVRLWVDFGDGSSIETAATVWLDFPPERWKDVTHWRPAARGPLSKKEVINEE